MTETLEVRGTLIKGELSLENGVQHGPLDRRRVTVVLDMEELITNAEAWPTQGDKVKFTLEKVNDPAPQ